MFLTPHFHWHPYFSIFICFCLDDVIWWTQLGMQIYVLCWVISCFHYDSVRSGTKHFLILCPKTSRQRNSLESSWHRIRLAAACNPSTSSSASSMFWPVYVWQSSHILYTLRLVSPSSGNIRWGLFHTIMNLPEDRHVTRKYIVPYLYSSPDLLFV